MTPSPLFFAGIDFHAVPYGCRSYLQVAVDTSRLLLGSDLIKTSLPKWGPFIFSPHLVPIYKDAFTAFKCGLVLLHACIVYWLHSVWLAAIGILLLSLDHYTEWLHTNDPHNNCTSWGIIEAYSLIVDVVRTHSLMQLVFTKNKIIFRKKKILTLTYVSMRFFCS